MMEGSLGKETTMGKRELVHSRWGVFVMGVVDIRVGDCKILVQTCSCSCTVGHEPEHKLIH